MNNGNGLGEAILDWIKWIGVWGVLSKWFRKKSNTGEIIDLLSILASRNAFKIEAIAETQMQIIAAIDPTFKKVNYPAIKIKELKAYRDHLKRIEKETDGNLRESTAKIVKSQINEISNVLKYLENQDHTD